MKNLCFQTSSKPHYINVKMRTLPPPKIVDFEKIIAVFLFLSALLLPFGKVGVGLFAQNIGINSTGNPANPSAILDVEGTTGGFLIPRLTTAQRNAIATPANSLVIFNTDNNCFQAYINTLWQNIFCDLGCSGPPAPPGTIAGNATPCQNATGITYSISAVTGATSYNWTMPAGASITSGQGTTSIVVNWGTTSGNVSVTASNNCGTSAAQTLAISLQPVPAQPSTITGSSTVCQGNTGVPYAVTNVAGVTYSWSYSGTGWTCASGCATNSITANYSGSATSGTLTVTPSNVCGSGTAQTLAITVNPIPAAPTANTATGIATTTFTANWTASAGATTYFLDVSTVSTFASFVTGFNNLNVGNVTNSNVTGLTCGTTYFYRVRAGNACGTSVNSSVITAITGSCCASFPNAVTFGFTGSPQSWTVPPGVTCIRVDVRGAEGGWNTGRDNCDASVMVGGNGGRVQGTLAVTPGQVLQIYVGGRGTDNLTNCLCINAGGWNGGGNGRDDGGSWFYGGSGGGGASDIRISPYNLASRVAVAGGGGGSGNDGCVCAPHHSIGGAGGGLTGANGGTGNGCTNIFGNGGTQISGGTGASGWWSAGATAGTLGQGGEGSTAGGYGGGGGGGGFYGGGGGGMGGGGGGSSYNDPSMTGVVHTQGFQTGNGTVIINW